MEDFLQNFFNLDILYRSRNILLTGLVNTVNLAAVSICLATALGLLLAMVRGMKVKLGNAFIIIYVDFFRALPTIVLFMVVYYMLPYLGFSPPLFWAAVVALTLNGAAYYEEIFRSGIDAVDPGQAEAGRSLGLTYWQTMRHVILPQLVRIVLPPATGNSMELAKTTVLASVISMPELLYRAQQAAGGIFANPTPLVGAALLFLVIMWPFVRLTNYLERRLRD